MRRNALVLSLALALGAGCSNTPHKAAKAVSDDLKLYRGLVRPAVVLTPAEEALPPADREKVLRDREALVLELGATIQTTADKLEEALR